MTAANPAGLWNRQAQLLRSSNWYDFNMRSIYENFELLKKDLNVRAAFDLIVGRLFSDTIRFKEAPEIIALLDETIPKDFIENGFERFVNVEWKQFLIQCIQWIWIAGFVPVMYVNHDQYGSLPCCLRHDAIQIQYRINAANKFDFRYRSIVSSVRPEDEKRLEQDRTVDSFKGASSVGTGKPEMALKSRSKATAKQRAKKRQKLETQMDEDGSSSSSDEEEQEEDESEKERIGTYHEHETDDGPIMGQQDIDEVTTFVFDEPTVLGQPTSILQTLNWEIQTWMAKLRQFKVRSAQELISPEALISTSQQKELMALATQAGEAIGASNLVSDVKFGPRHAPGTSGNDIRRDGMAVMYTQLERQLLASQQIYNNLVNAVAASKQSAAAAAGVNAITSGGGNRGGGGLPEEVPGRPGGGSSSDNLRMRSLGPDDKAFFVPRADAVPDFKDIEMLRMQMVGKATRVPEVLLSHGEDGGKTRAQSVGPDHPAEKMFSSTCIETGKKIAYIAEEIFARIYHQLLALLVADRTDTPSAARLAMFTKRVNLIFDGNVEPAVLDRLLDIGALTWYKNTRTMARRYGLPPDELNSEPAIPPVTSLGFEQGALQARMELDMANAQAEAAAAVSAQFAPPKAGEGKSGNGTPSMGSGSTKPLTTDKRSQMFNTKFIKNTMGPSNKLAFQDEQRDRRSNHNKKASARAGKKSGMKRKRQGVITRGRP